MLSGRRLDLLDPSPLDIEIEDIAHGLARVARWNGQTRGAHAFSVAQHSLIVADIVAERCEKPDARLTLAALLHDAPEYVIGDMITPFKAVLGSAYKAVEERLDQAVAIRFGLAELRTPAIKRQIKDADRIAAFHEAVLLAGFSPDEAQRFFGIPSFALEEALLDPWPVERAETAFLERFHALERAIAAGAA